MVRVFIRRGISYHNLPFVLFCGFLAFFPGLGRLHMAMLQRSFTPFQEIAGYHDMVAATIQETVTLEDIQRFASLYRIVKKVIPHYYSGYTPKGNLLYILELNNIDTTLVKKGTITVRDLELHLQLVRQIVWDCLIPADFNAEMYVLAILSGISVRSLGSFWSTEFIVLRQVLRSLRDKTLTKRFHRLNVAGISSNAFVRAIVQLKRHKFPPGSTVQLYNSLEDFLAACHGEITTAMIPKAYGGCSEEKREEMGLEPLIRLFVEQILSNNPAALAECSAAVEAHEELRSLHGKESQKE